MVKYVDDTTIIYTLPPQSGIRHIGPRRPAEELPSEGIAELFHAVSDRAGAIGMRVNCRKTQLLCISVDNGYQTWASFPSEDTTISSQDSMKLLGFMMGCSPGVTDHFEFLRAKFRARFWSLIHLRRAGISGMRLFRLYASLVRPALETNAVVFHSMLTQTQSEAVERFQKQVLRLCFGVDTSYAGLLQQHQLSTLRDRRERAVKKFVAKAMRNDRFAPRWFVPRQEVETEIRRRRPFIEKRARTERYRNSPLLYFQRVANDLVTGNDT